MKNLSEIDYKTLWANFLVALEQTANRWSNGVFLLIKTIAALFGLVALMGVITVSTSWYITTYGIGMFVLTLVLASFSLSVLSTMSINKNK